MAHSREEVESEFQKYVARGEANDWSAWADQFTEDAEYVEHALGNFHGREEIRSWIVDIMKPFPNMYFPVIWHVIDGDMVVFACWNAFPNPDGEGEPYQFKVVTILHYAGNGQWSYEEDIYNPKYAEEVVMAYVEAAKAAGA